MNIKYPFDPLFKHHLLIALGLAVWIFIFLALTEPLETNQLTSTEKLLYLPLYGLSGAISYLLVIPLQGFLFRRNSDNWTALKEILFLFGMLIFGLVLSRTIYLQVIVPGAENPYTLDYFILSIYLPTVITILPIIAIGRWAFGRYFEKQLADQKIEIVGEGT